MVNAFISLLFLPLFVSQFGYGMHPLLMIPNKVGTTKKYFVVS